MYICNIMAKTTTNDEDSKVWKLTPLEGSRNVSKLPVRGNCIAVASMESQDAIRGFDFAMAHLTEVAFWKSSDKRSPEDFIRSIGGAMLYAPDTLLVMESTANGVGNFFHREWLRSSAGQSDKEPVFVAWYEIEMYAMPVDDPAALWEAMDEYERGLWDAGLTLEQINWYHHKRAEYPTHRQMMAEFPTTPLEAFANSATSVFAMEHVERLRKDVTEPIATGDIAGRAATGREALQNVRFVKTSNGLLDIWEFPAHRDEMPAQRYVVGVDIGGVSEASDYSVITVMDCGIRPTDIPRVVASWRGHIPHDLLAWKCAAIAQWYGKALLVIESNTLESEHTDGDPSTYILERLARCYSNLYYRSDNGRAVAPGFHVNRANKTTLITTLMAAVRDGLYVERDSNACDELCQYERKPNGGFGARDGCHDDLLMTRALILGVLHERRLQPVDAIRRYLGKEKPLEAASEHRRIIPRYIIRK